MKATTSTAKKSRANARQWTLQEGPVWAVASTLPTENTTEWSNLLRDNATLAPRLRHAVDMDLQLSLCAEIHVEEPRAILDRAMGGPVAQQSIVPVATMDDLVLLCRESRWEPTVRPKSGLVLVPMDSAAPARLMADEGGGLRCVVELVCGDDASPAVREARALLLLRLCAEVRLMRALCRMEDGAPSTQLEVIFPTMPSPELLGHGLSALQTALRTAAAEFEAMGDETLASEFLATMRGAPSGTPTSQNQT